MEAVTTLCTGSSENAMPPKSYIVVGGGWFGIRAVRSIEKLFPDSSVTVIELGAKDYVDMNMQTPRLMADPSETERAYQPLSSVWKKAKLVNVKEVKEVTGGSVKVLGTDGEEKTLEADGIILATGCKHSSPLTKDVAGLSKAERVEQLKGWNESVKNSKAGVLIVGGGATGVELAGDLAYDFPKVKVTMINKPDLLLRGSKSRASMHKICLKQLEKLGVRVICGDSIEGLREDYIGEPKTFTTKKGESIEADVVQICVGARPHVGYASEEALDSKSHGLAVDNAMLCTSLPGTSASKPVWAIGDCTQYGGRGMFADGHIGALEASMKHFQAKGTTEGGPAKYHHKPSESVPCFVSVGRKGGASTLPFANKFVGAKMKGPDLALGYMYKQEFGLKV